MLPVTTPTKSYNSLEEIRMRKEQLALQIEKENEEFSKRWNSLFVSKGESTKTEWVASILANSMTAIDAFLLIRKLMKNYGHLFKKK